MSGVRRGFLLLSLGQVASILAGYGTHLVLARQLGPAKYGTYGVVLYVLSTVALILTAGLPEAVAKYVSETPSSAEGVIAKGIHLQLGFSGVVMLCFAVGAPGLAWLLNDSSLTAYFALSALAIPPVALNAMAIGAFNGQRRFVAQAMVVGGYGTLRFVSIIGLVHVLEVTGAVVAFILSPLLVLAIALPALYRGSSARGVDGWRLWRFARPVIVFTVLLNLLLNLDVFVVKAVAERAEEIGYYTAAATIARVPYFFFSSLGVVLLPVVSAAVSANVRLGTVISGPFRWILLVSLFVASVASPLAPSVLALLYGADYVWAATPLSLLIASGTLFTHFFILAYALNGVGEPRIAMRLTVVGVGVELVAALPLVRFWGATGAAMASCVTALFLSAALLWAAREQFGRLITGGTLLRSLISSAVTVTLGMWLRSAEPSAILLALPLALVHLVTLMVLGEIRPRELLELARGLRPGRAGDGRVS